MVHTNKVLTVSYGTFSCTLEGFEDSFGTMKAIAEYFRDLAADDRYFGAEPPQPDADMLARIAQREISRRVEAHSDDNGIVLRARDAAATLPAAAATAASVAEAPEAEAPAPAEDVAEPVAEAPVADVAEPVAESDVAEVETAEADEAPAEDVVAAEPVESAAPVAESAPAPVEADDVAEPVDVPVEAQVIVPEVSSGADQDSVAAFMAQVDTSTSEVSAFDDDALEPTPAAQPAGDSIAAKLQRIRAVVSRAEEEEAAPADFTEDQHAEAFLTEAATDLSDALDADDAALEAEAEDDSFDGLAEALRIGDAPAAEVEAEAQPEIATSGDDVIAEIVEAPERYEVAVADLPEVEEAQTEEVSAELSEDDTQTEELVAELTEDDAQTEELVADLTGDTAQPEELVAELTGDDAQTEELVAELTEDTAQPEELVAELTGDDAQTDELVAELTEDNAQSEELVAELTEDEAEPETLVADATDSEDDALDVAEDTSSEPLVLSEADLAAIEDSVTAALNEDAGTPDIAEAVADTPVAEFDDADGEADDTADDAVASMMAGMSQPEADADPFATAETSETLQDDEDTQDPAPFDLAAFEAVTHHEHDAYDEDGEDTLFAGIDDPTGDLDTDERDDHAALDITNLMADGREDATDSDAPLRARVVKVRRSDLEAAIAESDLEEVDHGSDEAILPPEEEAELMRELAEVEAELDATDVADDTEEAVSAAGSVEFDAQGKPVTRLMQEALEKMEDPEAASNRETYAHLRAAVAATQAEQRETGQDPSQMIEDQEYRNDLASVVRPRRPASSGRDTRRPAGDRPAPLKLVAEQRVDDGANTAERAPVRPRRVSPADVETALQTDMAGAPGGFVPFAEDVGAVELNELLEAAASYMSFVEGREQFSRPQLMTKVRQVVKEDFNREDGLRAFGQMLREGKIIKTKGGRFRAAADINFQPAERAAS